MPTVSATAPVRVCDAGGWTDTWFAGGGLVCSVAVDPGAEVVIELRDEAGPLTLDLAATGEQYALARDAPLPGRHPLLEQALAWHPLPEARAARVHIAAAVPPGSGVGTSAAVVVALLAAARASSGETIEPHDLARAAHAVETSLGL